MPLVHEDLERITIVRDGLEVTVGHGGQLSFSDIRSLRRQAKWLRLTGPMPTNVLRAVLLVLRVFEGASVDTFLPDDHEPPPPPAPEAHRYVRDTEWQKRCDRLRQKQKAGGYESPEQLELRGTTGRRPPSGG